MRLHIEHAAVSQGGGCQPNQLYGGVTHPWGVPTCHKTNLILYYVRNATHSQSLLIRRYRYELRIFNCFGSSTRAIAAVRSRIRRRPTLSQAAGDALGHPSGRLRSRHTGYHARGMLKAVHAIDRRTSCACLCAHGCRTGACERPL